MKRLMQIVVGVSLVVIYAVVGHQGGLNNLSSKKLQPTQRKKFIVVPESEGMYKWESIEEGSNRKNQSKPNKPIQKEEEMSFYLEELIEEENIDFVFEDDYLKIEDQPLEKMAQLREVEEVVDVVEAEEKIENSHEQLNEQHSTLSSLKVKAYPNPVVLFAYFDLEEYQNEAFNFHLFDNNGRLVYAEANIVDSQYLFDRGDLEDGVYYYQLISQKNRSTSGKLVLR